MGGLQVACQPQRVQHRLPIYLAARDSALIQQRQSIPQRPVCQPCQQRSPLRRQVDGLLLGDVLQPVLDVRRQDALEGEPLAAGQNGGRHLVQFGGGQDEHEMFRRLLQNLQQGIEGGGGEHMHFVHDVNPLAHGGGGVHRLVPQGTDLIHAVVGGGVQLHHI